MMDYAKFSTRYQVRQLDETDIPAILALCEKNPQYYEHCPPFVMPQTIREDMQALPPRKTMADKYYLGHFDDAGRLVAVMDFIDHCPNAETAFIGFYMVERSLQGRGIGSQIVEELFEYLTSLDYQNVRLGYVNGNKQSESFWKKNQFVDTGMRNHTEDYEVVIMNRKL